MNDLVDHIATKLQRPARLVLRAHAMTVGLHGPRLSEPGIVTNRARRILVLLVRPLRFARYVLPVEQVSLRLVGGASDLEVDRRVHHVVEFEVVAALGQPLRVLQQLRWHMPVRQVVLLLLLDAVVVG